MTDSEPVEWVSLRAMAVAIALEHHRDLDVAVKVYQEARCAMGLRRKSRCKEYMEHWLRELDDGNVDLRCEHHPGRPTRARGLTTGQVAEMSSIPHPDDSCSLPLHSLQHVSLRPFLHAVTCRSPLTVELNTSLFHLYPFSGQWIQSRAAATGNRA